MILRDLQILGMKTRRLALTSSKSTNIQQERNVSGGGKRVARRRWSGYRFDQWMHIEIEPRLGLHTVREHVHRLSWRRWILQ